MNARKRAECRMGMTGTYVIQAWYAQCQRLEVFIVGTGHLLG